MMTAPPAAWKRLGKLLVQRRIELSPKYRDRTTFAADTSLNWRLLHDIERAKRTNFSSESLAAIEVAYRLEPGAVDTALAGGELKPAPDPQGSQYPSAHSHSLTGLTAEERAEAEVFIAAVRKAVSQRESLPRAQNGN